MTIDLNLARQKANSYQKRFNKIIGGKTLARSNSLTQNFSVIPDEVFRDINFAQTENSGLLSKIKTIYTSERTGKKLELGHKRVTRRQGVDATQTDTSKQESSKPFSGMTSSQSNEYRTKQMSVDEIIT